MAFDWKKLEREDEERADRGGRTIMITYLIIGVLGVVVHLATGFGRLESALMYVVLGIVMFTIWRYVLRSRSRRD